MVTIIVACLNFLLIVSTKTVSLEHLQRSSSLEHHYLDNEICSSRDLGDGSFAAIQELSLKKNNNRQVFERNFQVIMYLMSKLNLKLS